MKHGLLYILGLIVLVMVAFATSPAQAQTTAPGPYYATPSWDQQLPASTRFIVLSNWGGAAVLDRETGLVWEQSPDGTNTYQWENAQSHCNDLTVGNRKGWRVPTIQELASLVDPSAPSSGPALPPGHPFSNVIYFFYWSSNTLASDPNYAWSVNFGSLPHNPQPPGGGVVTSTKTASRAVWCVRGGQGVDPQ
jgi:hypothetical protein